MVALLALYFKRSVPMSLVLVFFGWQFFYLPYLNLPIEQVYISLSIATPIAFMLIGLQNEKYIYNKNGLLKLVFVGLILFLSYKLAKDKSLLLLASGPVLNIKVYFLKPINDISFTLFAIAFFLYLIKSIFERELRNIFLLMSLLSASIPFLYSPIIHQSTIFSIISVGFIGAMLIQEIYKMAFIDTLTQVPSRRSLEEYTKSLRPPYTLCMVDIDHFKNINDTYGHDAGDEVLKYVAKELQCTKGCGKVFRYGGEEFTIIYPNKLSNNVQEYLEYVRVNISKKIFVIRSKNRDKSNVKARDKNASIKNRQARVTISLGVCDTQATKDINDLFVYADQALYKAKKDGRNCLKIYTS